MKHSVTINNSVTLPCSGCDGNATFTPEGERPTFFHTMPMCDRFNRVNSIAELTEYMRECFKKRDQKAMS
jgi:hypothetical protein